MHTKEGKSLRLVNYREILLSLQLVLQFLQLATHLLLLPGTQPTICQLLLLANYPQS